MADGKRVPPRPVRGKWTVPKGAGRFSHAEGFSRALDAALAKTHWNTIDDTPTDVFDGVEVKFSVKVHVYNPGSIVEYGATLIPGP
jgi:hypothetical protein